MKDIPLSNQIRAEGKIGLQFFDMWYNIVVKNYGKKNPAQG